jgi:CheY-like chemotaxis protein
MDCHLPEIDGIGATRRLREMGISIPVIAMSASSRPEEIAAFLAAGMNDYLGKPFRQKRLLELLQKWMIPPFEDKRAVVGAGTP